MTVKFSFFSKVTQMLEDEKMRFMVEQNQESLQFKHIVDSVEDAMIILSGKENKQITFKNMVAAGLFFDNSEIEPAVVYTREQFYCFSKSARVEKESEQSEVARGISFENLVADKSLIKGKVFTRHEEIGLCTSMAQA